MTAHSPHRAPARLRARAATAVFVIAASLGLAACESGETDANNGGAQTLTAPVNDEETAQENGNQVAATDKDTFVLSQGIEISGRFGQLPEVTLPPDFVPEETSIATLYEGSGDTVKDTDTVLIDYAVFDLDTGETMRHTYYGSPVAMELGGTERATMVHEAIIGTNVGSRVTLIQPQGENNDHNTFTVLDIWPNAAKGEAVAQRDDLPQVSTGDGGKVELTIAADQPLPTSTVVQPIIKGLGSQVAEGQQILVQLLAVQLPDGEILDSTWDNAAVPVSVNLAEHKTLEAWTQAVVGQTVGSRTLIVLPLAENADTTQADQAIAYVVDILHADFIAQEETS